jgi:hypothetical protein
VNTDLFTLHQCSTLINRRVKKSQFNFNLTVKDNGNRLKINPIHEVRLVLREESRAAVDSITIIFFPQNHVLHAQKLEHKRN